MLYGLHKRQTIVQLLHTFIPFSKWYVLLFPFLCKFMFLFSFFSLDINECSSNPCHQNATCQNTIGSFVCTCDDGYTGNGTDCQG